MKSSLSNVQETLDVLRRGGIVIVLDDDDRENEGDLILAAEHATPDAVNFLAKEARGLICAALTPEKAKALNLSVSRNANALHGTAFTESVDLATVPGSGISALDRSLTLMALASVDVKADDFARPGHIFPLVAKAGGVLERRGHTEATVDLCRLAGLAPAGVLCEIMNADGTMARRPELEVLAAKHSFPMITVEQLVRYRRETESSVQEVSRASLPTQRGLFTLRYFSTTSGEVIALTLGDSSIDKKPSSGNRKKAPLVRVHSECITGEVFGSLRCDCGPQLEKALDRIAEEGAGAVIYLRQEGRGIGLEAKVKAYALQEKGLDTWDANTAQGLPADARSYDEAALVLKSWGWTSVRLMTNNPTKIEALRRHEIEVEVQPLIVAPGPYNRVYLETKKQRFGHRLESDSSVEGV